MNSVLKTIIVKSKTKLVVNLLSKPIYTSMLNGIAQDKWEYVIDESSKEDDKLYTTIIELFKNKSKLDT